MKLHLELFGPVKIFTNKNQIKFPYQKAEALVIYLYLEGSSRKDFLADMLWGDNYNQSKARQNLRNCLYAIRKAIGEDIFDHTKNGNITISSKVTITSDYNDIINKKTTVLDLKDTNLLSSYYLKGSSIFNEWLDSKKNETRSAIIEDSLELIEQCISSKDLDLAEKTSLKIISIDEFDERAYMHLIRIYDMKDQVSKIISIYTALEKKLLKELGISPSKRIKDIVEKSKISRTGSHGGGSPVNDKKFFGRRNEIDKISILIDSFIKSQPASSVIITGEEGIGKTSLTNHMSKCYSSDIEIYTSQCYREEENFILKPWYNIIMDIAKHYEDLLNELPFTTVTPLLSIFPFLRNDENMKKIEIDNIMYSNYDVIEREVIYLLLNLLDKKKIILVIEDIQWIDSLSLSLIRNLLTTDKNKTIFFILNARTPLNNKINDLVYDMHKNSMLDMVTLERFNQQETCEMFSFLKPGLAISEDLSKSFYKETEGNPFYINELLSTENYENDYTRLTTNIRNLMHHKINILNESEKRILEIISIFFDGIDLDMLAKLSNIDNIKLINILDKLIQRNFIHESANDRTINYRFNHVKISQYIYSEMTLAKKKIYHGLTADLIEKTLNTNKDNSVQYTKLIYHFEKAGELGKYIEYTIKYLNNYLCVAHEFFPVIGESSSKMTLENDYIEKSFLKINKWIDSSNLDFKDESMKYNISLFYHMIGRFYIRKGEYEKGLHYIGELKRINSNSNRKEIDNLISANRQLVCIYINLNKHSEMKKIIDESLQLISSHPEEEKAIWYRLEGYQKIMALDTVVSRNYLFEAIKIFENSSNKRKYLINLAAAYNWVGESYRLERNYDEAREYYKRAISICVDNKLLGGTPIFYANYGQCLYENGELEEAEECFSKSIDLYKETDSIWGKSIPYNYYVRIHIDRTDFRKSLKCLSQSISYAKKIDNKLELSMIEDTMKMMNENMESLTEDLVEIFNKLTIDFNRNNV